MSKETFDFSEALKRMMQGKKVRRKEWKKKERVWFDMKEQEVCYNSFLGKVKHRFNSYDKFFSFEEVLATDWEEAEG